MKVRGGLNEKHNLTCFVLNKEWYVFLVQISSSRAIEQKMIKLCN